MQRIASKLPSAFFDVRAGVLTVGISPEIAAGCTAAFPSSLEVVKNYKNDQNSACQNLFNKVGFSFFFFSFFPPKA